jgi:hypothetical protein
MSAPSATAPPKDAEVIHPIELHRLQLKITDEQRNVLDVVDVTVKRLKAREFLELMSIMVRSIGDPLTRVQGSMEEVAGQLVGYMMMVLPLATDEVLAFLRRIVVPVLPEQGAMVTRALANPEPDDLLEIAGAVAEQEADDLKNLVGKFMAMRDKLGSLYRGKFADRSPSSGTS